jgi:hypothetical protein
VIAGVGCVVGVAACGTTRAHVRKPREPSLAQQFQIAGFLDAVGNPEPAVFGHSGGVGPIEWSMCAPSAAKCTPLATANGIADPGPQLAGTVFKVTSSLGARRYSADLRWHGALHVASPPTLAATPHVGAIMRVSAGHWTGGWGTEREDLGIEACRTVRGSDCVMLAGAALACSATGCGELGGAVGEPTAPNYARVGNWYTGWYLFALDARFGNPTSLIIGYASPAAIKPWPISATVIRSRPYGPVTGPPAPRVLILRRARVLGRRLVVAIIHCAASCRATTALQTMHPNRKNRIGWTMTEQFKGIRTVGVRGALPAGRAAVSVQVGNGPYVKGHTLIRRQKHHQKHLASGRG